MALPVVVKVNEHDIWHVRANVHMVNLQDFLTDCIYLLYLIRCASLKDSYVNKIQYNVYNIILEYIEIDGT